MRDNEREEVIGAISVLNQAMFMADSGSEIERKIMRAYGQLVYALDIDTSWRERDAQIEWELAQEA